LSGEVKEFVLGGQAVLEGVMMKGASLFSVAVRKASGEIRVKDFPIVEGPLRRRFGKTPFVRGVVTLGAMLVIGYRALQFSADEVMEDAEAEERAAKGGAKEEAPKGDGKKDGEWAMAFAMISALALAIGLFFWLPLAMTRGVEHLLGGGLKGNLAFNLVDGLFRVAVFVAYVAAISFMKDIRRVFEYHGAEHKVVHAHEAKAEMTPEAVMAYSRLHPRCGTSFLLLVMVVSILVFSLIPRESHLAVKALLRVALLPVVAGASYEILRLSARRAGAPFFRGIVAPGLLLQKLTTREPDLAQVEVALASFRRVLPDPEWRHVG
jgi:uncharacterized protein YqhQ